MLDNSFSKKKGKVKPLYLSPLGLFMLAACGGGGGTSSTGGGTQQTFSGFVIKGPLHNANIFADYDGDGVQDAGEPSAITASDGSYSLSALDNFAAMVVSTTDQTVDASSGSVVSGITLKAPKGSSVVSPTSTVVVESNLTVEEVATALGLPEDFTLDFNPFDANADPVKAAAVEKTSQMVMTTINAVSASAEGVGLSQVDAFKTAIGAIVDVVKNNVESNSTIDFADDTILEQVQTKAKEIAVEKGADSVAMHRAVDAAIESTKAVNKNIKEVEDIFSDEAKEVFKTAANISSETKTASEAIAKTYTAELSGLLTPKLTISSVANDNVINISEKASGFKVSGTAVEGATVTVTFGTVSREVTLGEQEKNWEVNFNFTNSELTALNSGDYPTQINATSVNASGSDKNEAIQKISVNTTQPTVAINALSGDGKVNIPERDAGLEISGTSNAEKGQKITVSLLDPSDNSVITAFGTHETTVGDFGNWSIKLPTANFPSASFKIKAIAENEIGNTNQVVSDAVLVDFTAPAATITDNISGTATGNITYTVQFSENVSFFSSNDVTITNGSVSSVSGVGKNYTVVVTPSAGAEGTTSNGDGVIFAINTTGGGRDSSGNHLIATQTIQDFDTKGPTVSSISVVETGTSNAISTVAGVVDLKINIADSGTVSGFTKADLTVSSGTLGTVSGSGNSFTVPYTPASNVDGNVTLTVSSGGYQDAVGNAGQSGSKVFAVDTKSPSGSLTLPSGSFSLGQKLDFSLTYDEPVTVASGDPFVILEIGDRVRLAEKVTSSDSSIVNFSYTVKNSDLDTNGIGITATTGLSKSEFALSGTFTAGDQVTVSGASGAFTVQSGATSAAAVATQLRTFLNSDGTFYWQ
ncbi:MAG: Ig-like domain-containing protein [Paracoccaceae bacterium]